ncbi:MULTISPECIES: ComF family protein [Vibrio]|uniref:ComF family protein n=1 Tax=Vibrio TaxID=662 RepID=UPI00057147BD|nr:ComF family protein [Vibrio pacinii]
MLAQTINKYIADLLPMQCEVCQLLLAADEQQLGVCATCQHYFSPVPRCQRCGLMTVAEQVECGQCLKQPPYWHKLYCVGDYQAPLSSYVHLLKYERQFWHARKLAMLLAPRIDQPADLITFVPLHWRRYLQRGFNQSELLAQSLAKQLAVPQQGVFRRTRATAQQQGLDKHQRMNNIHNAFALKSLPNVKRVAIVDDVLTTGSTVQHLCKLLLDAGVKSVDIYCICRTPEPAS